MPTGEILVVGAGISGLGVAHDLRKRGRPVAIVEAASRAGGVIGSLRRDGALVERGPNSTLDTTPLIGELLRDLGIESERRDASAVASTRYIVRGGKPVALPASPRAFVTSPAFTLAAKLRLLREPFVPPAPSGSDESIADFVRRRLGAEFLDYAIDPFVAGIYAGDPERISVPAAFPRLHALEQRYGSLIKGQVLGARERRASGETSKNAAGSFSFANGMQTLTDALARAVAPVGCGVEVRRIRRDGERAFIVDGMRGGEPFARSADVVVLAAPAYAAAGMIAEVAPAAANALAGIEYAPVAIVACAYRRADVAHPLDGFGVLVPKKEGRAILGCLFSSSMFEGRAPGGTVLLTTFTGGQRNPEVAALSDADVASAVRGALADLLGAHAAPLWQEVIRWPRAIPQYDMGHLERLQRLDAAEAALPGLFFCGSYRGGVAVGDRIKSAHSTAEQIDAYLRRTPH